MTDVGSTSNPYRAPGGKQRRRWLLVLIAVAAPLVLIALGALALFWRDQWRDVPCEKGNIHGGELGCARGKLICCTNLGVSYRDGIGVTQDREKAREILSAACDASAPYGCLSLGALLEDDGKLPEAYSAYAKGCRQKDYVACAFEGHCLSEGKGITRDRLEARVKLDESCRHEVGYGCGLLGTLWESGLGGVADEERVGEYYAKACHLKSSKDCERYRTWQEQHAANREEVVRLAREWQALCDARDWDACVAVASLGERRPSAGLSEKEITALYLKACEQGKDASSCNRVAVRQFIGLGGPPDRSKAFATWSKRCNEGDESACRWMTAVANRTDQFDEAWPRTPSAQKALSDAALALLEDQQKRSQKLLTLLIDESEQRKRVQLFRALQQMSDGRLKDVEAELALAPDDPIVPVLRKLLVRRGERPDEPWRRALIAAWVSEGKPDLRKSVMFPPRGDFVFESLPLTLDSDPEPTDPLAVFVAAVEHDRPTSMLSDGAWPEPPPDDLVLRAIRASQSTDRGVRLAALHLLVHPSIEPGVRALAHARARMLLSELSQQEPTNALWPLMEVVMEPLDWSLRPSHIRMLEVALEKPGYSTHFAEIYEGYLKGFQAWKVENPKARAFTLTTSDLFTGQIFWLRQRLQRAAANANPEQRTRILAIGRELGKRISEGGSFLEQAVGVSTMKSLLMFSGSREDERRSEELVVAYPVWSKHWGNQSPLQLSRWPIGPLQAEILEQELRGEMTLLTELDALGAQPP